MSMTGVARFCLLATVAFVMVSPGAIALEEDDSPDTVSEESPTCVYNLDSLDVEDLRARAEEGTPIAWNVLGRTVQYTPVVVAIEGDDARSMASQLDPRSAKAYVGVNANGADDVRMTVASDWVHVYFLIDNVEYMIDRMDGADGSDCYYVHSSYDAVAMAQCSDLFDVVVPDPAEQTRPSSEILPSDVNEANSSSPPALSSTQALVPVEVSASSVEEPECDNRTTMNGLGGDPVYRLASVICAADEEFRALYPNDWQDRILAVMNDMSGRYESQVLISFRICMYRSVDLPSENANALMDDFELLMDTDPNLWYVNRDLAHLFTGKDLLDDDGGNGVMGIAYVAGVRRAAFDDMFHEDIEYGLAYSISEQTHDSYFNMWLLGHEIGHNFNGVSTYHVHFAPPPPFTWPWYVDSWMADGFGTFSLGGTATFSDNNKARIKSWASQALDQIRTTNPGYSSVSGDSLQSSNIYFELADWGAGALPVHEVGKQMKVCFRIKNVGSVGVTLQLLFVAARDASGSNRDFGHLSNVYLGPQETNYYSTLYTPASGGTWTMWPGYKLSNHYGPSNWLVINPSLYYKQQEWKDHADTGTSTHADLWYRFLVLTPTANPTRGSTVTVSFTVFNSMEGTSTNTYSYIFAASRINMQESYNRDFGHSGQQVMTQNCSVADPTGGGYYTLATRTLDLSGTWYFWPSFLYNGGYGPWQWHCLSIVVP